MELVSLDFTATTQDVENLLLETVLLQAYKFWYVLL
jgi:hypothetical protein